MERDPRDRLNSLIATTNGKHSKTRAPASTATEIRKFSTSWGWRSALMPCWMENTAPPTNSMTATMKLQK